MHTVLTINSPPAQFTSGVAHPINCIASFTCTVTCMLTAVSIISVRASCVEKNMEINMQSCIIIRIGMGFALSILSQKK